MTLTNTAPIRRRGLMLAAASAYMAPGWVHSTGRPADIKAVLDTSCGPLLKAHDVPGLVVGLIQEGQSHFLELGTTARRGGTAATRDTIFELGSISKCFTAGLAALAHVQGRLNLDQPVGDLLPALRNTPIGMATPMHLATHTAGGLPLQFPEAVTSNDQAIGYLAAFAPMAAPGSVRQYSNPGFGLLGHATAQAMTAEFGELGRRALLAPLGLTSTYLQVPGSEMHRHAWGHDRQQRQVRVRPGAFDAEAYGLKSTASDMLRWLHMLVDPERMPPPLRQAMGCTLIPRYQAGALQQGMGWEMIPFPGSLQALLEGNGTRTVLEPLPVEAIAPSSPPSSGQSNPPTLLLNKTGSTSGFSAYVMLVPHRKAALVMLANRNFPSSDRVSAAHQVMSLLGVLG